MTYLEEINILYYSYINEYCVAIKIMLENNYLCEEKATKKKKEREREKAVALVP